MFIKVLKTWKCHECGASGIRYEFSRGFSISRCPKCNGFDVRQKFSKTQPRNLSELAVVLFPPLENSFTQRTG